jgi:hypothetical protein
LDRDAPRADDRRFDHSLNLRSGPKQTKRTKEALAKFSIGPSNQESKGNRNGIVCEFDPILQEPRS